MTADKLSYRILRLGEDCELNYAGWTVLRLDGETWKVHVTGTEPDSTGEFLNSADDVRAWAREVAQ